MTETDESRNVSYRKMGAIVLDEISRNNDERIAGYLRLKAETDYYSGLGYAEMKGIEKGRKETVINFIKKLKLTLSEALKAADLPVSERMDIIEELKRQNIQFKE